MKLNILRNGVVDMPQLQPQGLMLRQTPPPVAHNIHEAPQMMKDVYDLQVMLALKY